MIDTSLSVTVPEWVPDILRYGVIGLVLPPGIGKFLTYGQSVALFTTLEIPSPAMTVIVVGVIELGAVALLFLNTGRWIATIALLPVMTVAFVTAGDWQALAVLVALVGLLGVDSDVLVATEADV